MKPLLSFRWDAGVLLLGALACPASGQTFPADFEVVGVAGGQAPDAPYVSVHVGADGQGAYRRYSSGDLAGEIGAMESFALGAAELGQLWQAIQANAFFDLDAEHTAASFADRTFARLAVTANGATHAVTTRNIAVEGFDAVVAVLNGLTPGDRDLVYDTSGPALFTEVGICERAGKRWRDVVLKPVAKQTPVSAPASGAGQRITLSDRTSGSVSVFPFSPPELSGERGQADDEVKRAAVVEALASARIAERPLNGAAHPGTTVAYPLTLDEAVEQGLVSLTSKEVAYGDAVSITVDNAEGYIGDRVELKLYMEFHGPAASPQAVGEIEQAIESAWGGRTTSDGKPFDVDVVTRTASNIAGAPATPGYHQIELVESAGLSHVHDGKLNDGVAGGTWETDHETPAKLYAHEAGHLMGLDDRYDSFSLEDGVWVRESDGEPFTMEELADYAVPRHPEGLSREEILSRLNDGRVRATVPHSRDDLMSTLKGNPEIQQADIDALASQAGVTVEVGVGDILLMENEAEQNMVVTHGQDVFAPGGESTTLNGLYAACIDKSRATPSRGSTFDVGPALTDWGGIQGADLLQQLVEYIDRTEQFCEGNLTAQQAVWRITDNAGRGLLNVDFFFETAGIPLGGRTFDFPHMSNPRAGDGRTGYGVPSELIRLDAATSTGDLLAPGQTVSLTGAVHAAAGAWTPSSDFSWSLDAPVGSAATLTAGQGPGTMFTPDVGGFYRVHLQVEVADGQGETRALETDLVFMAADDHTETFENGPPMHRGTLQWLTNDFRWTRIEGFAHTGAFAMESAEIGNGQATVFGARFEQAAPGPLLFAFKVSSELSYDGLVFVVDDEPVASWSGQPADWDTYAVDLAAGSHTVLWVYQKDASFSRGEDRAWIDDVVFPEGARVVALEASAPAERSAAYRLEQNYPNPFNPATTITYAIPEAEHVRLVVYDAAGRQVATLVEGRREAGAYRVRFDARTLSNGVYYYELRAGAFVQRRSMVLLK